MERGGERDAEKEPRPLRTEIIDVTGIDPDDLAELPGPVLRRAVERICRETAQESPAYQRFNASI